MAPTVADVTDVDELYALDPGAFVAARDALASRMRTAGDREGATAVKALRRPTVTAWALNQLARRHGDDVRRLIEASAEVARVQVEVASGGDAAEFRRRTTERRELVHRLAATGVAVLDEREAGSGAGRRDALVNALEAASRDDEGGAALLAGRLSAEPEPPSAFGGLLEAASAAAEHGPRRAGRPTSGEVELARERVERARQAAEEAAEAVAAAEERVDALVAQLEEARARAERTRGRAVVLAEAVQEAEAALAQLDS